MTPLEIKIEMLREGITSADVGRKIGVSRVAVCRTRMGNLKSRRIQSAIAESIKKPVDKVFPNRKGHKEVLCKPR